MLTDQSRLARLGGGGGGGEGGGWVAKLEESDRVEHM